MVNKQAQVAARKKAREAKARRDAAREAKEKRVTEANEAFYIACLEIDEAKEALDAATDRRNSAVRDLVALDQDDEAIAELTGLSVRDVAKIKKTPGRRQRSEVPAAERPSEGVGSNASDTQAATKDGAATTVSA